MNPAEIDALIDDRPRDGVFRVHADVFRRQDLFELEMKHIIEATWVFVGLECQIPEPHDFLTTRIGRQPVIVSRDGEGKIHCLLNACRHRRAMVCELMRGNRKAHVCPYHGWAYDSAGRNISVNLKEEGGYTPAFDALDHNLLPVAHVDSYRGFIFASLNPDVAPLEEHLGGAAAFLDLGIDQGPDGFELIPGTVTYVINGNWKMQLENSADSYHFVPTHMSYVEILGKRKPEAGQETFRRGYNVRDLERGSFTFPNGHSLMWAAVEDVTLRALWLDRDEVLPRVGETRFKWMLHTRNLQIFPSFQLIEAPVLQVRINRPLAPDKTEITTYCIAPKGESRAARLRRLRQYEEFHNPSGLATPDDMAVFDACQTGQQSQWVDWHQGYMRGLAEVRPGDNDFARELGIHPETAVATTAALGDETVFHSQHREWRRLLMKGLSAEENRPQIVRGAAQ